MHKVIELLLPQLSDRDSKRDIHRQKAQSHFVDLIVSASSLLECFISLEKTMWEIILHLAFTSFCVVVVVLFF